MVSLSGAVQVIVYLLIAGVVFGLLYWLIEFVGKQFAVMAPFIKVAKVILVVLAVLVLINVLLGFAGHPLVRWQ